MRGHPEGPRSHHQGQGGVVGHVPSVDRVIDKLEHQIEKLKSRQQAKTHPRRGPVDSVDNDLPTETWDEERTAGGPRIVKSKRFEIKPMTPEEAALQMDMLGHGFYFFINADTGVAAVVSAGATVTSG